MHARPTGRWIAIAYTVPHREGLSSNLMIMYPGTWRAASNLSPPCGPIETTWFS